MALLKFVKYTNPTTALQRQVIASMSVYESQLEGDWLNPVPDLDAAHHFATSRLNEIYQNGTASIKHRPVEVRRDACSVYTVYTGVQTGKEVKLAGFELIQQKEETQ